MNNITIAREHITPAMAASFLENNSRDNRHLNMNDVRKYARDIKNGKFFCTHQGIAFDEDGNLIDGQHRLEAIKLADRPVDMLVTRNLPHDVIQFLDHGRTRSIADTMTVTNPGTDAAARARRNHRLVAAMRMLAYCNDGQRASYSVSDTQRMFDKFNDEVVVMVDIIPGNNTGCGRAEVLSAATAAMHCGVTKDQISAFFRAFSMKDMSGCVDYNVNAAIAWRSRIESIRMGSSFMSKKKIYLGTQNAIYHFVNNTGVDKIVVPNTARYDVLTDVKSVLNSSNT